MTEQKCKFPIKGLYYVENFLSDEILQQLEQWMKKIRKSFKPIHPCNGGHSRKIISFGWYPTDCYDRLVEGEKVPDVFEILVDVDHLKSKIPEIIHSPDYRNHFHVDQVVIAKYDSDQGMSSHIDNTNWYGGCILCLSIGSKKESILRFTDGHQSGDENFRFDLKLARNSLYILTDEARFKYSHAILPRKESYNEYRYSVTFRSINESVVMSKKRKEYD